MRTSTRHSQLSAGMSTAVLFGLDAGVPATAEGDTQ
jgi:hypothetical protein